MESEKITLDFTLESIFLYKYKAELIRVVDGDTVVLKVDCGFRMSFTDRFRLAFIDAPEHDPISTQVLKEQLETLRSPFEITTSKPDAYGRWLVTIHKHDGTTINNWLVDNGYAKVYK